MKHLIVYAHPNTDSLNHAILETTVNSLKKNGHEVIVRDLYALDFYPVLKPEDTKVMKAVETPQDIQIEQEYLTEADVITFIYPIWWAGLPAILKGYVDRVFSYGFAYGPSKMLKGKKGFMISTFGTPKEMYDQTGMTVGLKVTSDTGIFEFVGIEPVEHLFFGSIGFSDEEAYQGVLTKVEDTINSHFSMAYS